MKKDKGLSLIISRSEFFDKFLNSLTDVQIPLKVKIL